MKQRRIIIPFLIFLLLGDFTFSFIQYYNTPLYGDIENCVLPDGHVQKILDDPMGFKVILTGEKHLNPNRFFSHIMLLEYFQTMPFWLHKFADPITSLYLSNAILKLVVQLLFVYLLAFFISGKKYILDKEFLFCAVIIDPLFQVYGYYSRMGINDKAISYTFFYAIPLVLLMLFYIPVFRKVYLRHEFGFAIWLFLLCLTVILPLSGPLVAGTVLIISLLMLIDYLIKIKSFRYFTFRGMFVFFPPMVFVLLVLINLWSLYSLYLGSFNFNYEADTIPVLERYSRLPEGMISQLFHSFGLLLLLTLIGLNSFLIKMKYSDSGGKSILKSLKWIGVFVLLYLLLLPLGGYRPYRPLTIRYDTIMPVTIALIYLFGASTWFLIRRLTGTKQRNYITLIVVCLLIYTAADMGGLNKNEKERQALKIMANSPDSIVKLPPGYQVLSWEDIHDYKKSSQKAEFLYRWGITDRRILFYNEAQEK
jgi:hypothetical protein